jgi:hypothetical protein
MNTIIKDFITAHPSFTTIEFSDMLKKDIPDMGRSMMYHILKSLCDNKIITRICRGHYNVNTKKDYNYNLSPTAKEISTTIHSKFPLVDFQIWELYQMNEFVNHLISKNTIFVEVENILDETIFNLLYDKYLHVLHNPNLDVYYKYSGNETIIVRKLISEVPPAYGNYHQAYLEKILVDLFGRGISGSIIPRSEYRAIFEDSFRRYNLNQARMLRYARRRGVENSILDFIHQETNITLEDNK